MKGRKLSLSLIILLIVMFLTGCDNANEKTYENAMRWYNQRDYFWAYDKFIALGDYKDCLEKATQCKEEFKKSGDLFLKALKRDTPIFSVEEVKQIVLQRGTVVCYENGKGGFYDSFSDEEKAKREKKYWYYPLTGETSDKSGGVGWKYINNRYTDFMGDLALFRRTETFFDTGSGDYGNDDWIKLFFREGYVDQVKPENYSGSTIEQFLQLLGKGQAYHVNIANDDFFFVFVGERIYVYRYQLFFLE